MPSKVAPSVEPKKGTPISKTRRDPEPGTIEQLAQQEALIKRSSTCYESSRKRCMSIRAQFRKKMAAKVSKQFGLNDLGSRIQEIIGHAGTRPEEKTGSRALQLIESAKNYTETMSEAGVSMEELIAACESLDKAADMIDWAGMLDAIDEFERRFSTFSDLLNRADQLYAGLPRGD
ncbi:unnamed protein product, partial [Mesorhabditis spiculigera]